MNTYYYLLAIVAFLFSMFFCVSETSFSTINRLKVNIWYKSKRTGAGLIKNYVTHPDNFLVPTLIGNNLANVTYAAAITAILVDLKLSNFFLETSLKTIVLVLFAEIAPKIVAKNNTTFTLYAILYPFKVIDVLLTPLNWVTKKITRLILRIMGVKTNIQDDLLLTRDDIEFLVEEAVQRESVDTEDGKFISNIMDLQKTKVKEVMTHRSAIIAADVDISTYKLRKLIRDTAFSKIVIYEENLDKVKGVVYVRDLLKKPKDLDEIIKVPLFLPATTSVYQAFKKLQKSKLSIAIVVDEFGGVDGIVTMHDIFEEIIGGKVHDLHARERDFRGITYRKNSELLIVNADVDVEDFNKSIKNIMNSDKYLLNEDDYETINGFIINTLGYIPKDGDKFNINGLEYKIIRAKKNKIETVTVKLK